MLKFGKGHCLPGVKIFKAVASVVASTMTVLSSIGASYSTPRTAVLSSIGTSYSVTSSVLSSVGTTYTVI